MIKTGYIIVWGEDFFASLSCEVFMTIYSDNVFSGVRYSPVFTGGITRHLAVKVPTIYAVRADRSEIVACSNLASARAYAEGRAPALTVDTTKPVATVSVTAWVSPTGQYYVMHGNQRMDVANAATARNYVRNGVAVSTMLAASLSQLSK